MKVTVDVGPTWVKIAHSPIYFIATTLAGISVSFAPLFLYWSGKGKFYPGYEWIIVPLCFAVICLVPGFYYHLGGLVAKELRQNPTSSLTNGSSPLP